MASPSSWVDIQLVSIGDRQQLEIRRYTPMALSETAGLPGAPANLLVEPAEIRQARRVSTEELVLVDVIDASAKTKARVVESLLIETEPEPSAGLGRSDCAGRRGYRPRRDRPAGGPLLPRPLRRRATQPEWGLVEPRLRWVRRIRWVL